MGFENKPLTFALIAKVFKRRLRVAVQCRCRCSVACAGELDARRVISGTSKFYILSNNHVLANVKDGIPGDPILQPGPFDGGESWTYREMFVEFHALTFGDYKTGYAVGGDGRFQGGEIYRTADGGEKWTRHYFTYGPLLGVSFLDGVTGTVVGAFGTIMHTTTGGE